MPSVAFHVRFPGLFLRGGGEKFALIGDGFFVVEVTDIGTSDLRTDEGHVRRNKE